MGRKEENQLGLVGATAYIVGTIIGSGIFVAPQGILSYAGSVGLSLIIWVVSALLAILNGINYVEMGTSIPVSGAEIAYISYVGWHPIAFSFLYLSAIVEGSCSCAVLLLTFGQYTVASLEPIVCLSQETQNLVTKLFGIGLLFLLSVANMYSLKKAAGRIQVASMISKIAAVLLIIGIGLYFMIFKGETAHFKPSYAFQGSQWSPSNITMAIYQGMWAYSGYTTLNYGTEDIQVKNLKKTLPLAVFGGLIFSSVIYLLVNISYFSVLSPQEIMDSKAVATTFVSKTLGEDASFVMPALVALLMVGTLNSDIFMWSRLMLSGARSGLMPTAFSLVHPENDSPRVAVLVTCLLSVAFSFIGNVYTLVSSLIIIGLMSSCFALLSLIIIKWKRIPVAKEAVKFPIILPILNLLISIALLVIPFVQDLVQSLIALGLFFLGCAAYFLFVWPKNKPKFLRSIDEGSTRLCQKLLWTIVDKGPEYQKESKENEECQEQQGECVQRF